MAHCLGALDGKHVAIKKSTQTGTTYFNYKGFFFIVLMDLVNADYKFWSIQVGDCGSSSDGPIWNHCLLQQAIVSGVRSIQYQAPLAERALSRPFMCAALSSIPHVQAVTRGERVIKHSSRSIPLLAPSPLEKNVEKCKHRLPPALGVSLGTSRVLEAPFNSRPLHLVIDQCCQDQFLVPNIVHFVWFQLERLSFYHFLSILSAHKFLKPCLILIHGDVLPAGDYWGKLLDIVTNIVHVRSDPPLQVFGKNLSWIQHKSDIHRIEVLKEYGGIYLDTDVIVLRSFEFLRNYTYTMGMEGDVTFCNAIILAQKNATFLHQWYQSYKTYNPKEWAVHSGVKSFQLFKQFPDLIHVMNKTSFFTPSWGQKQLIYKDNYDWSGNIALHLYSVHKQPFKEETIETIKYLNTTLGSLARFVLFNEKKLYNLSSLHT
ncbi:hypothetical protein ScPMuIL_003349 [Solemya velum]